MLWFFSEPKQELGAPAPWSVKLAGNVIDPSDLVWSGDDIFVWGMWRPSSFVDKLLSGKRDQGDRDYVHRTDLIAVKQYS